ncbi:MAG: hypothetical protein JWP34_4740 [Massilia sp.]|nr:hypothetical protein [Massilia sp.]
MKATKKRSIASWGKEAAAGRKAARAAKPKMGRPRKGGALRVARGVRLDPELVQRVDDVLAKGDIAGVTDFTDAVGRALTFWLDSFSGPVRITRA